MRKSTKLLTVAAALGFVVIGRRFGVHCQQHRAQQLRRLG